MSQEPENSDSRPPRKVAMYIVVLVLFLLIASIAIIWIANVTRQAQPATTTTTINSPPTTMAALQSDSSWTVQRLASVIKQNSPIHFVRDSVLLLPGEKEKIDAIADALHHFKNVELRFRGHTADFNLKHFQYELSVLRASGVRWMLEFRAGESITSVTIQGVGSSEMISLGNSEADRAPNRRVEIFLQNAEPL